MKQNLLAPESVKTLVKQSSIKQATGGHHVTSLVLLNVEMFGKNLLKIFLNDLFIFRQINKYRTLAKELFVKFIVNNIIVRLT